MQYPVAKLSVIVPVYNEILTVESVLSAIENAPLPCAREIVVVDDASTDGTREFLQQNAHRFPDVRLFLHEKNAGKGAAVRTAIEHVTGDWAVIQDADLEYDPRDYEALLQPVLEGLADAVFGSRFLVHRYARAMFYWHSLANRFLTFLSNLLTDLNLTDMETCYKLVRSDILKALVLRSDGFALEPELTVKLARWGARIYEVPISYRGRTYWEGKKIRPRDGLKTLAALVRYRFFEPHYCKHDGFLTLQAVQRARRFNRWLFSEFEEWLGDEVLEAGCGIGNLTALSLRRKRLVCVDNEAFYCERLRNAYGHLPNFSVHRADLADPASMAAVVDGRPVDSVFCINVLEHIEVDEAVLRTFHGLLKPGGHAIVLVPHGPNLYSDLDRLLGHFRRYTPDDLSRKMAAAGFRVVACKGFNRVGGFGWRMSGKILRKKTLGVSEMRLFELGMPVIRLLEKIPFHAHNSLICVGRKEDA